VWGCVARTILMPERFILASDVAGLPEPRSPSPSLPIIASHRILIASQPWPPCLRRSSLSCPRPTRLPMTYTRCTAFPKDTRPSGPSTTVSPRFSSHISLLWEFTVAEFGREGVDIQPGARRSLGGACWSVHLPPNVLNTADCIGSQCH
jgi:hypothetical protein